MKKLIPGEKYTLQYTGQYCHSTSMSNHKIFEVKDFVEATFVGEVSVISGGKRNIFYTDFGNTYIMFDQSNLDYIVEEEDKKLLESIRKVEEELKTLKQKLNGKIK